MPWVKMKRDLKKGDVIRLKITNPEHLHYGDHIYALCTGEGFGCSMKAAGRAIFVIGQSHKLEDVLELAKKKAEQTACPWIRWNRTVDIEILEGEKHEAE